MAHSHKDLTHIICGYPSPVMKAVAEEAYAQNWRLEISALKAWVKPEDESAMRALKQAMEFISSLSFLSEPERAALDHWITSIETYLQIPARGLVKEEQGKLLSEALLHMLDTWGQTTTLSPKRRI